MEDLTGKQLGPFEIIAPLGEGGMAAVFKAYQPSVDRMVALKVLPRQFSNNPEFMGRFEQEAKIIAKLQHPNILPVHDYGEHDGYAYIVMPFVETGTLADLLLGQPLPLERIVKVVTQLGDALDYAHSKGIIHRDVKPSNVLIDSLGNCLLTDFGIAKIIAGTSEFTQSGYLIGTPAYMYPDQGMGEVIDNRSDVYSLGVILYEMITGRVPYAAETPIAILMKRLNDPLPVPHSINPNIPENVEKILLKSLARNKNDRYSTAGEFSDELSRALKFYIYQGNQSFITIEPTKPPLAKSGKGIFQAKRTSPLILGFIILGSLGLLTAFLIFRSQPLPSPGFMKGEFNIALAEFSLFNTGGTITKEIGEAVSQQIFLRVQEGLSEASKEKDIVFEVWGPNQVGRVTGDTPESRAEIAEKIAANIGADLLIYGIISDNGSQQTILPEMYVSERLFSTIPEFLGQQPMGNAIVLVGGSGDLQSRVNANRAIGERIKVISVVSVGLSMFNLGDYETAYSLFTLAEQSGGWQAEKGEESLYLMLGNTAGRLEHLSEAEGFFEQALEINPEYARAHIGLGETYFRRSFGIPPVKTFDEVNVEELDLAEKEFRYAVSTKDQPATADIISKANFGFGRLALTRFQISDDQKQLQAAENYFSEVIKAGEAGNTRISEIVAQSHGHLGTIDLIKGDPEAAKQQFEIAVSTSKYPPTKAAFFDRLGDVYSQMGSYQEAQSAYEQAIAIEPDESRRSIYQEKISKLPRY